MSQICNLIYADLAQGRNQAQMAELEAQLAPPEEKERLVAATNREVVQSLGHGMMPPPRKR